MVNILGIMKDIYVVRSDDPNFEGFRVADGYLSSEDEVGVTTDTDSELEDEGIVVDSHDASVGHLAIGQTYQTKESFKQAVDKYAITEKKNIMYKRSDKMKVAAICAEEDCQWRIYASINSSSFGQFVVRNYQDEHTCDWNGKVRLYTAKKIAKTFLDDFRVEPLRGRVIKARLEANEIYMSRDKCQKAREHCSKLLDDEHVEMFSRMWDYVLELRESNPGSTIILGTKDQVFDRFYACFNAQNSGWKKACRPIIHLDGTHLKGRMKGQVLSAIGRDANDGMYPIAWAIVEVENRPNWEWFLELLRDDLDFGSGNGTTIISD